MSRRALTTCAAGAVAALAALPLVHASAASPTPGATTSTGPTEPIGPATSTWPTGSTAPRHLTPPATSTTTAPSHEAPVKRATAPAAKKPQDAVTPDYGFQKYRVGVQVASGAYVPPGTTTAGTELTITDTPLSGTPSTTTCTTDASTAVPGSTATFCLVPTNTNTKIRTYEANHPDLTPGPTPPGAPTDEQFLTFPGDTVTITQTTVEPNLVIDSSTATLAPCTVPPNAPPFCQQGTDEVFDDAGLPPVAVNDAATVVTPHSVDVPVLANDQTHGAPPTIAVATNPAHGTTAVSGTEIAYTPAAGFVGVDHFTYTLTTANGTSTATVTITVLAPPPTAVNDTATTPSGVPVTIAVTANDNANGGGALSVVAVSKPGHGTATISGDNVVYTSVNGFVGTDKFGYEVKTAFGTADAVVTVTVTGSNLAGTGVQSEQLIGFGGLLLLTGGIATAAGRRRRLT